MNLLFRVRKYLEYRLKATNEHGVHSPFVFDLLLHVLYNKADYYRYADLRQLRMKLLRDRRLITFTEFGAGGSRGSSSRRRVSDIARNSAKSEKYSQLLFRLVNYFHPPSVLELGTSLGISGSYIAAASSSLHLTTLEGCDSVANIAEENFRSQELNNVTLIRGNFDETLPIFLSKTKELHFVFFDGNHQLEPTLRYFELCLERAGENSVFVFDDIYWSPQMADAWSKIKAHPRVTVTIDLFQMGIVFFRQGQRRQDFVIRF